ncbi:hypothetical protein [Cyanobium sp. NIES-981]|uniref:hypothetical protein n=1 Tax=Cyanobium sp. NIES-981 TaxID=1851505 RepID=UPI0007DCECA6|nr:hypothetical protein [Cyanobium sp. NIES-981]SBO42857.1 conserved membrane protein of unknown function [Cyanobium sp. NIES-981]
MTHSPAPVPLAVGAPADQEIRRYPMAPLIRGTLLALYLALVTPLPALAPDGASRLLLAVALVVGLVFMLALTSEQVQVDREGLRVCHPAWCRWLLRRGWSLPWTRISGLTPVATSQGGRVYYVRGEDGCSWLLPQRVARFEDFLGRFAAATGLPVEGISRISPPWTYQLLAGLTGLMLLLELAWTVGALRPLN